jgi:hypothetical protein
LAQQTVSEFRGVFPQIFADFSADVRRYMISEKVPAFDQGVTEFETLNPKL